MSKLMEAAKLSQQKVNRRPVTPSGNIIFKPSSFTDKETAIGTVLSGPAAGQEMELKIPNNGPRAVNVKKLTTPSQATTSSYIDIEKGGTMRCEGVKKGADGIYTARWVNVFDGRPEEGNRIITDAVVQLRTVSSEVDGQPDDMYLNALFPDEAKNASTMEELEERIVEAFASKGGVHIFFDEDGEIGSFFYRLGGVMTPDGWTDNDPKERASYVMESISENRKVFEEVMSKKPFSVVPFEGIKVGPSTGAEILAEIENAITKGESPRINTIDPSTFRTLSTGLRVLYALREKEEVSGLPKDAGEKLKEKFLQLASDDAKKAFLSTKQGWSGVSNDDMRRFFEAVGVDLPKHPEMGWTRQNILIKKSVATKTFGNNNALPFPPLEICKGAYRKFQEEMFDAIRAVVDGPVKAAEAEAPKAKADEAPKADAAAQAADVASSDADVDDLDALLDGVQDADMTA